MQTSLYKEIITFRETLKLYHFQCVTFPEHKASDEILIKLDEQLDKFFEMYQGHEGRLQIKSLTITINGRLSKAEMIITADRLKDILKNYHLEYDLANVRDEIIGTLSLFIYLLSFK